MYHGHKQLQHEQQGWQQEGRTRLQLYLGTKGAAGMYTAGCVAVQARTAHLQRRDTTTEAVTHYLSRSSTHLW